MAYSPKNINGQATMANSEPIVIASDQSAVPVSAASLPLPTGASTSANQTTVIGHLDGVEGLLTTIDADTGNISTKIDTIAGAVAGTEMQVDVLTMPTVTVNTHAVTATDLDIRNLVNTDVVTAELSAVDNAVLDAIAASVALIDTVGGGTEATAMRVTIANDSTGLVSVDDNGGSITVDAPVGTPAFVRLSDGAAAITTLPVSIAASVTVDTELPTAAALADNVANPTVPGVGAFNMVWDGVTWDRAAGTSADGTLVNLGANNDVTITSGTVTSLTQMNGQAISMGTGVRAAGTQRVTIATDDIVPASQSGTWTVQPGNTQNTTEWLVIDKATTTGGLSKAHLVSAATTNATNVKASAGQVYAITAFNLNASPRYLKLHNTAGTPTAGTGVTDAFLIPGNTSGAGLVINFDKGIAFSTGIGFTLVTGITDASAVAVAADEIVLQIYYK